jgi:hypothetical protein
MVKYQPYSLHSALLQSNSFRTASGQTMSDWVIVLKMGPEGQLSSAKLIREHLKVPASRP